MPLLAILCPIAHSAAASFAWLLDTQSSGRIGSPIVAGSRIRRRSSSSVASISVNARRPPPGRRTTPDSKSGAPRSRKPRPIVLRAIPVALFAASFGFAPKDFFDLGEDRKTLGEAPQVNF